MKVRFLHLFFAAALLAGCQKNEWKEPTQVQMTTNINQNSSSNGKLQFNSGFIKLHDIQIEGERQKGEDVYFTLPLNDLEVNFGTTGIPDLAFEMPQGAYTYVRFIISTANQDNLMVEGSYERNGQNIPVRVEIAVPTYFNILASPNAGNSNNIVLNKEKLSEINFLLDPIYWFAAVSNANMDNASLTNINGTPTILINQNINTEIFDKISSRIDDAAEVLFD